MNGKKTKVELPEHWKKYFNDDYEESIHDTSNEESDGMEMSCESYDSEMTNESDTDSDESEITTLNESNSDEEYSDMDIDDSSKYCPYCSVEI